MSLFFAKYIPSSDGTVVKIYSHASNIIAVVYPNEANMFGAFQDAIRAQGHSLYLINDDGTQTCLVRTFDERDTPKGVTT